MAAAEEAWRGKKGEREGEGERGRRRRAAARRGVEDWESIVGGGGE